MEAKKKRKSCSDGGVALVMLHARGEACGVCTGVPASSFSSSFSFVHKEQAARGLRNCLGLTLSRLSEPKGSRPGQSLDQESRGERERKSQQIRLVFEGTRDEGAGRLGSAESRRAVGLSWGTNNRQRRVCLLCLNRFPTFFSFLSSSK